MRDRRNKIGIETPIRGNKVAINCKKPIYWFLGLYLELCIFVQLKTEHQLRTLIKNC